MAAEYQLTAADEPCSVIRQTDSACIPPDMANRDYNGSAQSPGYVQWKEAGGAPDPYVPPPDVPPEQKPETTVLYDHENRLRAIEGIPPLTLGDMLAKMQNGYA